MRRRAFAGALVVCCLMAHAVAAEDGEVAQRLSSTLRNAQKQEELKGFQINVKVENGVVWMKGSVRSKQQQDKALDLARRVDGVRLVVNDLRIEGTSSGGAGSLDASGPQLGAQANMPMAATQTGVQQAQAMGIAGQQMPYPQPMGPAPAMAGGAPTQVMILPVPYPAPMPVIQGAPGMASQNPRGQMPVPVQRQPTTQMVNYAQPVSCAHGCMGGGGYDSGAMGSMGAMGPMYDSCGQGGFGGGPVPEFAAGGYGGYGMSSYGQGGVVYDEPQMPNYAWPGYAAHPNYAALQYPQQYSPMAWPYIGPFYPYPQVPLGWRKVALEWDDGWWWLDFKSK